MMGELTSGGKRTPAPKSRGNIARTGSDTTQLELSWLKGKDFPALKKFHKLETVTFRRGNATDEKLETLAQLGFTNLQSISTPNCWLITDRGIEALTRIPTLRGLNLRGTPITDRSVETITTKMRLEWVHLCKCTNVTARSLLKVVQTQPLRYLSFSCENLTEADVIEVLEAAPTLKECDICLPNRVALISDTSSIALRKKIQFRYEGATFWHGDSMPNHFEEFPPLSPE